MPSMKLRFLQWLRRRTRRPVQKPPIGAADRPVALSAAYQRLAHAAASIRKDPEPPAEPIDRGD